MRELTAALGVLPIAAGTTAALAGVTRPAERGSRPAPAAAQSITSCARKGTRTGDPGHLVRHQICAEEAFAHGEVHTTPDLSAVHLWLYNTGTPHDPAPGYDERLSKLTGALAEHFRLFDHELDAHHPTDLPHQHLAIFTVRPKHQRPGLATALLEHHHRTPAAPGTPAYLEAGDAGASEFYLRHGYRDRGDPIRLPQGPTMYPMLRVGRP